MSSKVGDLERLGLMLDEGKIDRDEYTKLKSELLDEIESQQTGNAMEGRPPGWYEDPSGQASHEAYWDGESWTGRTRRTYKKPDGSKSEGRKLTEAEIWFQYKGRISAGQYWGRFIIGFLATLAIAVVAAGSGAQQETMDGLLGLIFLFGIWPGTALAWKRLHDQGRSGAMFLLVFIPLAGPLIWLVFSLLSGTQGPNEYGPHPGYRWADQIRLSGGPLLKGDF